MKIIRYSVLIWLAACSSGDDGAVGGIPPPLSPPPPAMTQSPGGVWTGTRPNGTDIVVFISETGEMRIVDAFGNQGFGPVVVSNSADVASDYLLAPPFGGSLIDGSDAGSCTLIGTLQERQSIDYEVECMTALGGVFGGTILLTYDPVYDTDSSIARIAGMYDMQGDVLTVDVSGALFVQNSQNGCVVSGQVSILDNAWNLYDVSMTTDSCQGSSAPLNGATWGGLATILIAPGAELVAVALTADVNGLPVSLVLALARI
jgi:hypothetical protein